MTYLVCKELFRPKELTFLEVFIYFEDVINRINKSAANGEMETRDKLIKSIYTSELRNYDMLKETIKNIKNEYSKKT